MSERSGWHDHEQEQMRRWRRLSHAERLAWLWQAKRFAAAAAAAAEKRRAERQRPPQT